MPHERIRNTKRAVILLVEDDPGDQELTRRALQHDVISADLRIVDNGEQALDYLLRREEFADSELSPTPDLILLDLNMPKMNGREFLEKVREFPAVARIPVVVLTTSEQEADIVRSYDLGCSSYIQKPVDIDQFVKVVRNLRDYWLEIVTLPTSLEIPATAG